jgi:hypothetical protein
MGPVQGAPAQQQKGALIGWFREMTDRGLIHGDRDGFENFVGQL